MSYYPEYESGMYHAKSYNFQPGPPPSRRSPLYQDRHAGRRRAIFFTVGLVSFLTWVFINLRPEPDPLPLLLEALEQTRPVLPEVVDTTPFWDSYRQLLTAVEDYDDWFLETEAATREIETMWARVHGSDYHQRLISSRANHLRLAQTHWERFLDNRERLIIELAGSAGALWRIFVDGEAVDEAEAKKLEARWGAVLANNSNVVNLVFLAYRNEEGPRTALPRLDEHTDESATLRFATWRVVQELKHTHDVLFQELDEAYERVKEAEDADVELENMIRKMRANWVDRGSFTTQMVISVSKLKRRLNLLRERRWEMAVGLEWLQTQFPEDVAGDPETVNLAAWTLSAKELLHDWAAALLEVQQGVLFLLRRRELPRKHRLTAYYMSMWDAWKSRNCGDTSCYSAPSIMANVKSNAFRGKPVANVAQDEADWIRSLGGDGTPRVWRGVYDKACCQPSVLGDRLQYGSNQQPGMGNR